MTLSKTTTSCCVCIFLVLIMYNFLRVIFSFYCIFFMVSCQPLFGKMERKKTNGKSLVFCLYFALLAHPHTHIFYMFSVFCWKPFYWNWFNSDIFFYFVHLFLISFDSKLLDFTEKFEEGELKFLNEAI